MTLNPITLNKRNPQCRLSVSDKGNLVYGQCTKSRLQDIRKAIVN